jgi:hypothetical protein
MDYEIIDNALPPQIFEGIQNLLMGYNFAWYYQSAVAGEQYSASDPFYFSTHLYKDCMPQNDAFGVIVPVLQFLKPKALIRIKTNMYPNMGREIINDSHVDYDFAHTGAILYINTNNGYTILKDGTKIESVANRILKFDSSKPHQSTHCTDQKVRVNINFNYF